MDGITTARERIDPSIEVVFSKVKIQKGDLFGNVKRFRALIQALKPATMLTHNFGSIEWAIANRISLTNHIHVEDGFGPEEREFQLPRRVLLRRVFLRGRTIVLPSLNLMRIAREVWHINPQQLCYIPNGIDLHRFSAHEPSASVPRKEITIGTVAALRPEKNIARLIRAFHHIASGRPVRLLVIGDGPQRLELEGLAAGLGLDTRVEFLGHVTNPDALIKTFDIFAMSSDTEQMPISLLEAMAAGLPTAATNVGDIGAMLPEEGLVFVTRCDDLSLASALRTLIDDPALRARLGQASRAKAARNFDQADMFHSWSRLLDSSEAMPQVGSS